MLVRNRQNRSAISDNWPSEPAKAIALQKQLAPTVRIQPLTGLVDLVAGVDVAIIGKCWQQTTLIAGVIVYQISTEKVLEKVSVRRRCPFPYVPGLLSFREAPAVLEAIGKLRSDPQVFMLDGQGIAHPRRFGLASHVGVLLDKPTIGCAKSRLCGQQAGRLSIKPGSTCRLLDHDQVIGAVVRTRRAVKPLYVSVGHKITLAEAVELVLACCKGVRLPQPTRYAHQYVTHVKQRATHYGAVEKNKC